MTFNFVNAFPVLAKVGLQSSQALTLYEQGRFAGTLDGFPKCVLQLEKVDSPSMYYSKRDFQ
jgi:hypothetical protein